METYLSNAYAVALVALGIGFVIFIHELGHFLMAKWAGVKVEKFAIGFGPVLASFRKGIGFRLGSTTRQYAAALEAADGASAAVGETEYSLRALPLGGYVKMLGEEPGGGEAKSTDPRAFQNRPVGARMMIISAGVVMNMLFGLVGFVGMYLLGVTEMPAVLGGVVAGQPAYEAGFRAGDDIVAIDGHREVTFQDLARASMLSGVGQKVRFEVRRQGVEKPIFIEIEPKRGLKAQAPSIGALGPASLSLAPKMPGGLGSDEKMKTRSTVTAVGLPGEAPRPVADIQALYRELARDRERPLTVVATRGPWREGAAGDKVEEKAVVPPRGFRDLGMRLTPGAVVAVRKGSPAESAGFRRGDQIVAVDGKADFDPMRLPDIAYARAGGRLAFEVRRPVEGKAAEALTIVATPDDSPPWVEPHFKNEPLDVAGLGLGLSIVPKVASVTPGSPAEKAGIKAGEALLAVSFPKEDGKSREPVAYNKPARLDEEGGAAWPWIFDVIQDVDQPIRFSVGTSSRTLDLTATPAADWFDPLRGLRFLELTRPLPPQPLGEALRRGWRDTREAALSFYVIIRNMIQGRLSTSQVIGPVKIADVAFHQAKDGDFAEFLRFLAAISINLAVVNFLPIPPLDGGQMTFLVAEKVRGKPLPDDAVLWPTLVGVALVLLLFVVVLVKDIWSYF